MKLLVKAYSFGTVEVEVEASRLTLEVAATAAEMATKQAGWPEEAECFTVYEAANVERGRIVNVREGRPRLVR